MKSSSHTLHPQGETSCIPGSTSLASSTLKYCQILTQYWLLFCRILPLYSFRTNHAENSLYCWNVFTGRLHSNGRSTDSTVARRRSLAWKGCLPLCSNGLGGGMWRHSRKRRGHMTPHYCIMTSSSLRGSLVWEGCITSFHIPSPNNGLIFHIFYKYLISRCCHKNSHSKKNKNKKKMVALKDLTYGLHISEMWKWNKKREWNKNQSAIALTVEVPLF
jgi:hypothetical protein